MPPYTSGASYGSRSSVIAGSSGSLPAPEYGVAWSAYTLTDETKTQCAVGSAATARRTHDGVRATSTTTSNPPSTRSGTAAGSWVSRSSGEVPDTVGERRGAAARGRHLVLGGDGDSGDRAGEELGAAENQHAHRPIERPAAPSSKVVRCRRTAPASAGDAQAALARRLRPWLDRQASRSGPSGTIPEGFRSLWTT